MRLPREHPPRREPSSSSRRARTASLAVGSLAALAILAAATSFVLRQRAILAATNAATNADAAIAEVALESVADELLEAEIDAGQGAELAVIRHAFNVLLVTVDTLRHDLGFTGYPRPVTPNLDALAARSTVFTHAYATASYTPKSLGPMLIGKYATETSRDGEHYTTFYPDNVFVAERLQAAGVRTVGAMAHHYFVWPTGLAQGFDVWNTKATPAAMTDNDPTATSEKLTDVTLELLSTPANTSRGNDGRFFAWVHYLDPHAPYVAHAGAPSFASKQDGIPRARAPYDGEVWFTDHHIGRLLDFVAAQPWASDTAIIFTADHGEAFGEHGHEKHGRELWEAIVRVPLVIHVPGAAPRLVEKKRSHIDLVPTILELMGIDREENDGLRGTSLIADLAVRTDGEREERDVYLDMPSGPFNEARRAILTGPSPGDKLIDFAGQRFELYDLAADPDEKKNLARDRERVANALARMKALRAGLAEKPPSR